MNKYIQIKYAYIFRYNNFNFNYYFLNKIYLQAFYYLSFLFIYLFNIGNEFFASFGRNFSERIYTRYKINVSGHRIKFIQI